MLRRLVTATQLVTVVAAAVTVVLLFANEPAGDHGAVPAGDTGRAVYIARCASCHGGQGQGGVGPALAGRMSERFPDPADQIAVVVDGRGPMPAFGGRLTDDEIQAVVEYTRGL